MEKNKTNKQFFFLVHQKLSPECLGDMVACRGVVSSPELFGTFSPVSRLPEQPAYSLIGHRPWLHRCDYTYSFYYKCLILS